MDRPRIRMARQDDAEAVTAMLANLAQDIGDEDRFCSDAETIARHGFGARSLFTSQIAETETGAVGLALYFPVFSTTRGLPGLYVQDLWVSFTARGQGLGRALLAAAAAQANAEWGAEYLGLTVYHDNEGAQAFYQLLGFAAGENECPMTLDGAPFQQLRKSQ